MNEEKWKVTAAYRMALVELMDKQDNISAAFEDGYEDSVNIYKYFSEKYTPKYTDPKRLIQWFSGKAGVEYLREKGYPGTPEEFVRKLCFTFSERDSEICCRPKKRELGKCNKDGKARKSVRKKVKRRLPAAKHQSTGIPMSTSGIEQPNPLNGKDGDMDRLNAKIESLVTELKQAINERTMLEIMSKVM